LLTVTHTLANQHSQNRFLTQKKTRQCEDDLSPFTKSPDWELFVHGSFLW